MARRPRKADKEIIKEIEAADEFVASVLADELLIAESDSAEQKRLKTVFQGFRVSNPELWKRDKEIYLNQIKQNGGK